MRDPKRLDKCYAIINEFHKDNLPDWRIGQLLMNFMGWYYNTYKTDCFYIEDAEFVKRFKQFVKEMISNAER